MTAPTLTILAAADFAQDGAYSFNLGDYIDEEGGGFSITRGVGADRVMAPATLTLNLNNESGIFTPGNNLALLGKMVRGIKIRVRITAASTYSLFTGRIVDYRPTWGNAPRSRMEITAEGNLALLAEAKNLTLAGSASRDVDDALLAILTAAGFTSADWTLPDSAQLLTWHYNTGGSALEQIRDVLACELGGLFFEGGDSKFVFIPEHDFCVSGDATASYATPKAVWGDNSPGSVMIPEAVRADYHWDALAAKQTLNHALFVAGSAGSVIYTHPFNATTTPATSQIVPPGGTLSVKGDYTTEVSTVITPVVTTDWTANLVANGGGADATADLDLVAFNEAGNGFGMIWQNNNAANVYLTFFQVRGTNILTNQGTGIISYELAVAQLPTTVEAAALDVKFRDVSVERDGMNLRRCCYSGLRKARTAWPWVEVDFTWRSQETCDAIFAREIGDLIRLQDEGTFKSYIDDWFRIVGITHHYMPNRVGTTTFLLKLSHLERTNDYYCWFDTGIRAVGAGIPGVMDTSEAGATFSWLNAANWELAAGGLIKPTSNTPGMPYLNITVADGANGGLACGVDISGMAATVVAGIWFYGAASGVDAMLVVFDYSAGRVYLYDRTGSANGSFKKEWVWTAAATGRLDILDQNGRIRVYVNGAADPIIDDETCTHPASPNYAGLYHTSTTIRSSFKHPYYQRL